MESLFLDGHVSANSLICTAIAVAYNNNRCTDYYWSRKRTVDPAFNFTNHAPSIPPPDSDIAASAICLCLHILITHLVSICGETMEGARGDYVCRVRVILRKLLQKQIILANHLNMLWQIAFLHWIASSCSAV